MGAAPRTIAAASGRREMLGSERILGPALGTARYAICLALCLCLTAETAEGRRDRDKGRPDQPTQNSTCNDVPAHPIDVVLGRPARDSVTVSVMVDRDTEGWIAYGTQSGHLRVRVSRDRATVEFVRAWLPEDERADRRNRSIADSYTIAPRPVPSRQSAGTSR